MPGRKTRRMRAAEEKYRRPLEVLLQDLYDSLGSCEAVAKALGVTTRTAWEWLRRYNIPLRRWMVPPREREVIGAVDNHHDAA